MSYDGPRLAAFYDIDNPDGPDHDFFRTLARTTGAKRITDLGCGTGILTITLAEKGRRVTGIDPSQAMLDRARTRPGGDEVRWVLGTADLVPQDSADLVVMSGNVAMHIVGTQWPETLARIAQGLCPGGMLAFESRNPGAREWRGWNDEPAERSTPAGRLRESTITDAPDAEGVVTMHLHTEFLDDGDELKSELHLQFRSPARLVEDLAAAGLRTVDTYRNWTGEPFTGGSDQPLMVFVAVRE